MKIDELIERINKAEILQTEYSFKEEKLPKDIREIADNKFKFIKEDIDIDRHRWYELSTTVYSYKGRFIGIRGASVSYGEMASWSDFYITWEAFEMEEVKTTTYVKKK